jgi:hypothetical protein
MGQVVAQLFSHCMAKPAWKPWLRAITKAETNATMIAESKAPKSSGAWRRGIFLIGFPERR